MILINCLTCAMSKKLASNPIPSFKKAGTGKLCSSDFRTRKYIASALADLPNANATALRVPKNQERVKSIVLLVIGSPSDE